ncbi:rRNA biogenesis protein rrp5 [Xylographa opegraphella]|nr:rRNA biogenesis protein rrp5 [Xylographa opegraphella]
MPSFKRKTETESGAPSKKQRPSKPASSAVSILKDEEPAFPRGGASILTPLERKQIQIRAKQDVLFEQSTGKKVGTYESEDEENEDGEPFKETPGQAEPRRPLTTSRKRRQVNEIARGNGVKIEGLSYKRLVPGSMVLGQVSQINRYDIALTLPNNLTGYIPITSISDNVTEVIEALAAADDVSSDGGGDAHSTHEVDLNSIVAVGQYLRAYVSSTNDSTGSGARGRKHVELSINPKQANHGLKRNDLVVNSMVQAVVSSVEDHGVVMNLGLEDTTIRGFMSSKEVGNIRKYADLKEGAVYLCLITGLSSNGNIIKLSASPEKIGNVKKSNFLVDAPNVDCFLPGTAVEVLVSEVLTFGLAGKVMGLLDVTADVIHSGVASSGKALEKKYSVGTKIKGRVLCTFPAYEEKKLGISLLDHIMSFTSLSSQSDDKPISPTTALRMSSIVDHARVARVVPGLGVFVDLGVKGIRGFVHISHLSDKKVETISDTTGSYMVGTVHRARILNYNPMDGLFLASFEQSVLELPFLKLEDVEVGQIVKGKVSKLVVNAAGIGGVLVSLTENISGLVSEMHLADVHLQHPEKKFREGLSVTARVLSINLDRRLMRLTLKKSLVNSDAAVWSSYQKLAVGMQAPGTLINILPAGAVVQFYGNVRGFLPVSQMSESYIKDPTQHFRVGQVVNVNIISIDNAENRMIVSCRDPISFGVLQQKELAELQPGAKVDGIVSEKTADEIIVELGGSGLKAYLPFEHLVDGSATKCLAAAKKVRVGQGLQNLMVISKNEMKRIIRLTNKPSLIRAHQSGRLPVSLEELKVGDEVFGFVKNIIATGVFIQFAGDLTGFLPAKYLGDEASGPPDFGMRHQQSISAKVQSIDHRQNRFSLTQKPVSANDTATNNSSAVDLHLPDRALSNPIDKLSASIDDFTLGKLTKVKIVSIKETQMNVQLADSVQGRIDVSQIFDTWEDIKDRKHPLKSFNTKQILSARILGVHDSRNHRFLPITHSNKAPVFELSAKPTDQTETELDILTLDKVRQDSSWLVFVNNIADDCLWVNLSPNVRGRIRIMDVSDDVSLLADLASNFPVGSALRARVVHVNPVKDRLDLSARSGAPSAMMTMKDLSMGMVVPGRVTKVTERYIMVQLSEQLSAPVHLVDMVDDYDTANPTVYQKNQTVRVCVSNIDLSNKRITLSARPSKVLSSSLPVKDPEITSVTQLKVNDVVRGFVKNVADSGVFVTLSSSVTAYVRVTDLSDSFIKDWKSDFQVDQLVTGKIIAVDPLLHHIQMSLKRSVLSKDYKPPFTYADVLVGQIVTGKIRKVEDFGVFIVIDNSANVSGLCHRSEIAEERVDNVQGLYEDGDSVKAKVLKVDLEMRRISFGLKASYFAEQDTDSDSDDGDSDNIGGVQFVDSDERLVESQTRTGQPNLRHPEDVHSNNMMTQGRDSGIEVEPDIPNGATAQKVQPTQGLSTSGFDWSGGMMDRNEKEMQFDTDGELQPRKKKRRKAELKIDKTGDLDTNGPQSVADFERLLLGQPNSSFLWLSYMAFELQLSEVSKARGIAERAIRTINQGQDTDSELLNVWVAYLNLENTYGTDETVEEIFKRACEYNDPEEIHSRLASIYIQSGKNEKAEAVLQVMVKKFSQDPKVWLNHATFLFDTVAAPQRARDLLPRALQSLSKHHHVDLTSKFAQMEFRSANGDAERGRTIFEGLLITFPKRLDLWNVMLDLEVKAGDKDQVRRLFGRVTSSKLKPKKAKYFFKRWLEFEEKEGDAQSCEKVKARAAEYVRHQDVEKS